MGAGDAEDVFFGKFIFLSDGVSAAVALIVVALFEAVAYGDALVEYEALAVPEGFFLGDGFEVFEDTALEVVDVFEALGEEVGGGLFAANAAGAVHGNFFVFFGVEVIFDVVGKFAEARCLGVEGVFEGTDVDFVVVTGVDEGDVGLGD